MLESKRRAAIFLILSFILASAAGYLVFDKVKALNAELGGMTEVYVADGSIPARTIIKDNKIATMAIPNKFVTDSHITNRKELENKVLVIPVGEGDMITSNMVKPASNLRNENHRLVAIRRTEKVQFDQVIEALDRVDIIISTETNGEKRTELFMADVPVAFAQGNDENFAGIAVEVKAEEAPELIHMQNYADHIRVLKANVGKEGLANPVEYNSQTKQNDDEANDKEATKNQDGENSGTDQQETNANNNNNE